MKKPVVIGLAIAAIVAVIAGGTWWYQSRQDDGLTLYGNVDIRTVNISFRVGGRLASLNVDEAMPSSRTGARRTGSRAIRKRANAGESWRVGRAGAI